MHKLIAIFAALAAHLLIAAPANARWYQAETDHFVIYSEGSKKQLSRSALKLERFDAVLRLRYGIANKPDRNKLTIYLLANQQAVRSVRSSRPSSTAGFYSSQLTGSFAVSHRKKAEKFRLDAQAVLFHEYAHHFMSRHFTFAYPHWYREGFAEYYATATFDNDGNWTFGKAPLHRSDVMDTRSISIERLLFAKPAELSGREGLAIYSRGWMLVHMMHSNPGRNRQLTRYLLAVGEGTDPKIAAVNAFGDLKQLNRDLNKYLNQKLTYIASREPIIYSGMMTITELDKVDSQLTKLTLDATRSFDREKTLAKLQVLAAKAPDRAPIWLELGKLEHKIAHSAQDDASPNVDAAMASIDRALSLDPGHGRANAEKASLLFDVADTSQDDAVWALAREHVSKANRANPNDPFPLSLFYDSYTKSGDTLPQIAHLGLARAFELAPEVLDLRVKYAYDLASQKKYDEAIQIAKFLGADPHNGGTGSDVVGRIEAMRDGVHYIPSIEVDDPDEEE